MTKFKNRLKTKLLDPLLAFLNQGMTPQKLALSVSVGFAIGLFPLIGITTLFCLAVSLVFKLNVAAMQLINYVVYPLQLLLLIPLIRFGSWLVGINPIPFSITELLDLFNKDFFEAINTLWFAHVLGMLAWSIIILPLSLTLYVALRFTFNKLATA